MKIVIAQQTAEVQALYLDTDTVTLNGSGLTVNGVLEDAQITAGQYSLLEDVTAEAFLVGINNHSWRYYAR